MKCQCCNVEEASLVSLKRKDRDSAHEEFHTCIRCDILPDEVFYMIIRSLKKHLDLTPQTESSVE
jgi:hypothetical protein